VELLDDEDADEAGVEGKVLPGARGADDAVALGRIEDATGFGREACT
jgi:hypothetical protein